MTASIVKDSEFVYVTASATVKIPIVEKYFGSRELKAVSAPEFKGD